jgi:hypothetical protein
MPTIKAVARSGWSGVEELKFDIPESELMPLVELIPLSKKLNEAERQSRCDRISIKLIGLFRLGLEAGIEAAAGVGSQLKKDHDDNDEHSPDLAHLSGGQVRQEEVLATAPAQCFHRVDDVSPRGRSFGVIGLLKFSGSTEYALENLRNREICCQSFALRDRQPPAACRIWTGRR